MISKKFILLLTILSLNGFISACQQGCDDNQIVENLKQALVKNPTAIHHHCSPSHSLIMKYAEHVPSLPNTVRYLLDHKANPDERCDKGHSALDHAVLSFPVDKDGNVDIGVIQMVAKACNLETRAKAIELIQQQNKDVESGLKSNYAEERCYGQWWYAWGSTPEEIRILLDNRTRLQRAQSNNNKIIECLNQVQR